jgi:hypothetical protein
MMRRTLLPLLVAALAARAQKYDGPVPPKPDLPYLKHATNLIATEVAQAKQEKKADGALYTVEGPTSSAKTPLALPILLIKAEKLPPDKLILYRLDPVEGRRQLSLAAQNPNAVPIHMEVTRVSADGVYKIEVSDGLEIGEYVLRREGSDQVFCFQVY